MIENYKKIREGHWYQIKKTAPGPNYSSDYIEYYNKIPSQKISEIRYNLIKQYVKEFNTICDFGYGNGSFIKHCYEQGHTSYGFDISDYPVPKGVMKITDIDNTKFDVITFFDSIEHIEDWNLVDFLIKKKTKFLVISLPWMHEFLGPSYFQSWKHRKPNEHFHHFDVHGLIGLLNDSGFKLIHVGNEEDEVRKPINHWPNILTVVAEKV